MDLISPWYPQVLQHLQYSLQAGAILKKDEWDLTGGSLQNALLAAQPKDLSAALHCALTTIYQRMGVEKSTQAITEEVAEVLARSAAGRQIYMLQDAADYASFKQKGYGQYLVELTPAEVEHLLAGGAIGDFSDEENSHLIRLKK
ncbi:hypothetical protein [Enterococcus nangangensis]|uniref:hypothetical protein n=1 Tax=Enterococcus nangangensis TaxID=2559926 RepID=UPI0010F66BE9|nr:hypothetical protein [Enterococcus nangangensis]